MSRPLTNIGTSEIINLPDFGITGVPAKIDTGADSSSIWVSNVSEADGELSFTLFAPNSPYYSGEYVRTRKYKHVTVKNSFGHAEQRYKVDLRIQLGERTIKANMNLANRSNNRFPVLIGKRTLRGKFAVDVSRRNTALGNQQILLIHSGHSEAATAYTESLRNEDLDIADAIYEEMIFKLGGDGNKIEIINEGRDIAEYSLVYFRTSQVHGHIDVATAIANYLDARNVDYIDRAVTQSAEHEKLSQYVILTDNNIPVPDTIFELPGRLSHQYEKLVAKLGVPFVMKDIQGRRGKYNYLVETKTEFDRIMRQTGDLGVWMLAQRFIPNDCIYRLITLGGQVALAIKRGRGNTSSHLYSVSRGSQVELIDPLTLPAKLTNIAPMAAKLLGLQIAGVDLVQDKSTKLWYCLEVNKAPQLYSGSFIKEKEAAVAKYLSQRLYG